MVLTLLIDVEPRQDLSISLRKLSQDLPDEPYSLAEDRSLLGISPRIDDSDCGIEFRLFAAVVDDFVDMGGHLAPDDRPDEPHQALWFAQLSASNRLHYDHKGVVDFVIQLLGS